MLWLCLVAGQRECDGKGLGDLRTDVGYGAKVDGVKGGILRKSIMLKLREIYDRLYTRFYLDQDNKEVVMAQEDNLQGINN